MEQQARRARGTAAELGTAASAAVARTQEVQPRGPLVEQRIQASHSLLWLSLHLPYPPESTPELRNSEDLGLGHQELFHLVTGEDLAR